LNAAPTLEAPGDPPRRRSARRFQLPSNKQNKLARLADERRERNKTGTFETVTMEDRLARLEEDIRRLKVEYDIYFNGGSKAPAVRHEAARGNAAETAGRRSGL
jgi:hypothetical protein